MKNHIQQAALSAADRKWSILLLFGCFCIGFNVSIALHELGHAFTMVLDGVGVREYVLNPFSWSWTFPFAQNHPIFTASGGVTFGLFFAIIPYLVSFRFPSPYFKIPALVTAAFAFSINGIYLMTGALFKIGDGGELLQYGVPLILIILTGMIYLLVALHLFTKLQPILGLSADDGILRRFFIFSAAIAPYLLLMVLYNFIFNRTEIWLWTAFAAAGIFLLWLVSVSGYFRYRSSGESIHPVLTTMGRGPVYSSLIIGLVIVFGELIVFGIRENPFLR